MQRTFTSIVLIVSLLACSATQLTAQQPHYSQFFANLVALNPAYAGFDAGVTLSGNYRSQWFGIRENGESLVNGGYQTFNLTADLQLPCILQSDLLNFGLAITGFQDNAGGAPLRTSGMNVALSYEQQGFEALFGNLFERLDVRLGVQYGFMTKQLNSDELIYSYQLDPIDGLIGPPESLRLNSDLYSDLSVGILIRGAFPKNHRYKKNVFTLGFTLSNLRQPNVSLFATATNVELPMRMTSYLGFSFRINPFEGNRKAWYIAPQWRWDRQRDGTLNTQTLGAYILSKAFYGGLFLQYNFPSGPVNNSQLRDPVFARNSTVLSGNVGWDLASIASKGGKIDASINQLILGLSYDINLGGLPNGSTLGVIEIYVRLNFAGKKSTCGRLGRFELYDGDCPVRF
ncbi:MAG: PorP/SprF family type IX secretion system membrane protein [Bacteroidota bacterium]